MPGREGPPARVLAPAALTAVLVLAAAAAGIGMRATYGAQLTADEPQYLLSALSLVDDGDLDIADELAAQRWREFHAADLPEQTALRPDGSRLSPHNPLLPLLLAGPVALGTALAVPAWVSAKAALALVAAILAGLTVWTAGRRLGVPPRTAAVVVTVFGASPPLSVYATQLYPELMAALAVTAAVAALTGPRTGWGTAAVAVIAVVALPWLAVKYAAVAAVLAAWALWRLRGRRAVAAGAGVALAAAGAGYLAFNRVVYGGWTPYAAGDFFVGGELTAVGPDPDYGARTQRLLGLLVDREFGLVPWQPAWLLLPVVLGALTVAAGRWRTGAATGWLLGTLAAGWATATWVAQTMHGWWWPGRQLVVVLPVAVLLVAAWAAGGARRTWPVAVLGVLGIGAHVVLVAGTTGSPPDRTLVVDFATTPWPPYEALRALSPALMTPTGWTAWSFAAWAAAVVGLVVLGRVTARLAGRHPPQRDRLPPPASRRRAADARG
ncbi:MAG: hypothetical protein ACFCVF_00660 [Kineosporiaceae bacterium]